MSDERLVFLGEASAAPEALRERGAAALERALAFVLEYGDTLSAHCSYVALRAEPGTVIVDAVAPHQAPDGSFEPPAVSSRSWLGSTLQDHGVQGPLLGTLEALVLLGDARQDDATCAEAAVRFVEARQSANGSFASGAPTSPDESSAIVATGVAAGVLGRSRYARPEVLADAGAWLGGRFGPERVERGHAAERAAFAMYYSNAHDDRADEVLQWCGRELERGFRSRELDTLAVMQVLLACQVGSLPGASFAPEELLERLLEEQAADGGFDALAAGGPKARVAPTIDAQRAIIGLCAAF